MTGDTRETFKKNAAHALHDPTLQQALHNLKRGFVAKRQLAMDAFPEFDRIRDNAKKMKDHTLLHLDYYLEEYEKKVIAAGGVVHWASDADDACHIAINISASVNAKLITKGKSMVAEEIGLNDALTKAGFSVIETDLGEYIIQLRHEAPSHIVAPAIHVLKEQVRDDFHRVHLQFNPNRDLSDPEHLLHEARTILREKFIQADVGITGANCLIAENGASVIVTNEGNGDLTQTCAKIHIVIASIEKIVPTIEDAMTILRLLPRSATGQEITTYVTFSSGPKRPNDLDGPEQYHVILIDNNRSTMLGTHYQDMLRCIRCGACLNHCPVYHAIGGQAYLSVYPGPMGAVLSPSLFGLAKTNDLPNASTFCGRCEDVCPMQIPLPRMMRSYRELEFKQHISPLTVRTGIKIWAFFAKRPRLYHFLMAVVSSILRLFGNKRGRLKTFPFFKGWTEYRDLPIPTDKTFHTLWNKKRRSSR